MKRIILFTFLLIPFLNNAQNEAYSFVKDEAFFYIIDTATFTHTTDTLTSSLGNVNGVLGADTDPCGDVFVVYNSIQGRNLGKVNLSTGVIDDIGTLNIDGVANITFSENGVLYAVTGDGSTVGETLFTVDTSNAQMTQVLALGNGNDGESIEYCTDDGKIYHWSGWATTSSPNNVVMESIDINTLSISNIPLHGPGYNSLHNVAGSSYAGNGKFLVFDVNNSLHFYVDTSGLISLPLDSTNQVGFSVKGVLFLDTAQSQIANIYQNNSIGMDSICSGDTIALKCLTAGSNYQWYKNNVSTGITDSIIYVVSGGNYTCTILIAGGCTINSNSINITELNTPNVNINPNPASYCYGDSVLLSGSSGGSSQWYVYNQFAQSFVSISGATNNTFYATNPGTYNMQKTNSNGCSALANNSVIVTENLNPTLSLSTSLNSDTICIYNGIVQITSVPSGPTFSGNGVSGNFTGGADFDPNTAGIGTHVISAIYTDSNGCIGVDSLTIYVDACATVNESSLSNIQIIPNPNNGTFKIEGIKEKQNYLIKDIQGKIIKRGKIENKLSTVNIDFIKTGIYFIEINENNNIKSIRFVVEK